MAIELCVLLYVCRCVRFQSGEFVRLPACLNESTEIGGHRCRVLYRHHFSLHLFLRAGSTLYALAGTFSILSLLSTCWTPCSGIACHPMNTKQVRTTHTHMHAWNTSWVAHCIVVSGQSSRLGTNGPCYVFRCLKSGCSFITLID